MLNNGTKLVLFRLSGYEKFINIFKIHLSKPVKKVDWGGDKNMRFKQIMVLLICMMVVTSVIGCDDTIISSEKNDNEQNKIKGLVTMVDYPEGIGFEDYDGKRSIRDNNQVSLEYLEALNNFSHRTISELLPTQERSTNIMYSPISLYMALALSASAANGQTQEEILSLLDMKNLGVEQLEEQTGKLFRLLYTDNEIGKLRIANSLWLDRDISFSEEYLNIASDDYYASIFSVDFSNDETGDLISNWISQNSNGTLEGTNPINPEQIMTIINTIYFYDEWTDKFNEDKTKKDTFYSYDGKEVLCDFMNMKFSSHRFIDGEGYICSSLRFKNNASMNFYLPDEGIDVYDLIATQEKVNMMLDRDNPKNEKKFGEVIFKVPKFDFGATLNLKESLQAMGMKSAFKSNANFTMLTDDSMAYISDIIQSTHISIDEKGCEASAYTKIDYFGSALPKDKAEMILDRPFIFSITSSNGVVLFMGVINNPIV